ncbi:MAG: hypothetical protein V1794_13850 [Candidatus Glassbacteria bacterium]
MDKSAIKQLERVIEVVLRSIPKERQARDVFRRAAGEAKAEMARILFESIANQEEQHETKLKVTLELLKQELDEARGKGVPDVGQDHMEEDLPAAEKIADLERVMEVVLRMIPKEHSAGELYASSARQAERDFTRSLFQWLADQEGQHESKLRGILDLIKLEIQELRRRK